MKEDHDVVLTWAHNGESPVNREEEPGDFLYRTAGDLYSVSIDDDFEETRDLVGKFAVTYVDIGRAYDARMPTFEIFDTRDELTGYFGALYGSDAPEFDDKVTELCGDVLGWNVLILDWMELLPKYRGKSLGLNVIRHMMSRFGAGAAVVIIKAFPLQFVNKLDRTARDADQEWRSRLGLDQLEGNERKATRKLLDHYSKLGFVRIPRSPYMVRSTAHAVPELGA